MHFCFRPKISEFLKSIENTDFVFGRYFHIKDPLDLYWIGFDSDDILSRCLRHPFPCRFISDEYRKLNGFREDYHNIHLVH